MNDRPNQSNLRRGRRSIEGQVYLITTVTLNRCRMFGDFRIACAVVKCFEKPRLLGNAKMLAWVLMPDHAHWLLQLGQDETLNAIVLRLKSASARSANQELGRIGPIWQPGYHDRALRRDEDLLTAARYLVANPLRAGMAQNLGGYPYWNAVWL